ncbi:sulfate permease CysP [Alicyclobacillus hesperidum subsp. aegles]|uniref:inorganic phosphate transporter n=1 Tax=Alicyclobacillus hesperidum TaxID=89784 RepID=UPI0007191DC2|nr:inorganic phosphate transporter [Alicyclobacillus hesperidum]KRW91726.1 sulfate permease [Alicyclobacillus tengchongensis]GLG00270.1 sulfate permease CysP [Alicyclobacillus hesperidum subsp. aegles]
MVIAAWLIALFFAANIGASGTAASMGAAYGAGAVRKKWVALLLVAMAAFLGAVIGGGSVVKTIGSGIVPSHVITVEITVIILGAACLTLFGSNLFGVPLSTSEVTVGAVVGAGLAMGHVYYAHLLFIIAVWLVMPFIAMCIAFMLGILVRHVEPRLLRNVKGMVPVLIAVLVLAGCYEAFSAGMNNVANAVGPMVASGILTVHAGLYWGALFVSLGALTLGSKVLDTNAKKITKLSLMQGIVVSFTSATLVLVASILGLPVPQTQATTMAIFGVGQSHVGSDIWRQGVVTRILKTWIVSPVTSLLVSYLLVDILARNQYTSLFIAVASVVVAFLYWSMRPHTRRVKVEEE